MITIEPGKPSGKPRSNQQAIRELRGKLKWEGGLDQMRGGKRSWISFSLRKNILIWL